MRRSAIFRRAGLAMVVSRKDADPLQTFIPYCDFKAAMELRK